MRGTKAKRLRQVAEVMSVGKPARIYQHVMVGTSPTATIELGDCTRKIYKSLKREYGKSGEVHVRPENPSEGIR